MSEQIKKEEFYLESDEKGQKLHCVTWQPKDGKVKAVVQIVHGMVEYVERYDEFAGFLTGRGYAVIGHDHLGHGKTAATKEELGFFAEKDGDKHVIADLYRITCAGRERWPNVPLVIMGHSMGSFFTRKYLTRYSRKVDGAIIMGTGFMGLLLVAFGKFVAGCICRARGNHYRSRLLYNLTLGGNNKRIKELRTDNDWLSTNEESVDRYNQDPFCTFIFTAGAYRDFFTILTDLAAKKNFGTMNRDLPLLFVAGEEDPVGNYGKGVRACHRQFESLGFQDLSIKLYPGDRHEILNELDRHKVFEDIAGWLNRVTER
ncbi:MAG: alpha/beta hydrolase [Lachnospiraceae bacterium]|jgi:alpha-beta hydrolase superfamily lysophospholipase|nr:alpha/beta hydrolase [Lachnospiraceae bacterium]